MKDWYAFRLVWARLTDWGRDKMATISQTTFSALGFIWLVAWSAPSHCLKQCWNIVNWTLRNKLQWNFNQNTKLFIHENASENILCKKAAILSRGRWVNLLPLDQMASVLQTTFPETFLQRKEKKKKKKKKIIFNFGLVIRTLHDCPSQMNENLLISNSKLTSDSELIWWR